MLGATCQRAVKEVIESGDHYMRMHIQAPSTRTSHANLPDFLCCIEFSYQQIHCLKQLMGLGT